MEIKLENCSLRPWREGDQAELVRQANNPHVARHLRERFPQPYLREHADAWIAAVVGQSPAIDFAIAIAGRPIGGIGLVLGSDVHRVSAEFGYWLGEEHWGRGIATCAVAGLVEYAFSQFAILNRLFANVDAEHGSSIRVLEKTGFRREGTMLGCAIKQGELRDQHLYALARAEWEDRAAASNRFVSSDQTA